MADDGSPRKSAPILSTSSIMKTGLLLPADECSESRVRAWPHVGAAMSADFRLIVNASRLMRTNFGQCLCYRFSRDVLPTPGGLTKHKIGLEILLQFAYGKVFENAFLDFFQAVVIFVENFCLLEIQIVLCGFGPGQPDHPIQIVPRLPFRRVGMHPFEAADLPFGFLATSGGILAFLIFSGMIDLFLEFVAFTEFLLNRLICWRR